MHSILVVDHDWYIRAQIRKVADDAGYLTAELADATLLGALLRLNVTPMIVIARSTTLRSIRDASSLGVATSLWPHQLVEIVEATDARLALEWRDTPVLPLPILAEDALEAIRQADDRLAHVALAHGPVMAEASAASAW